jgi:hypothetical protein
MKISGECPATALPGIVRIVGARTDSAINEMAVYGKSGKSFRFIHPLTAQFP